MSAPPPPGFGREPPSGGTARVLTLLAAFWLWFLLPVAVIYQRRARREVEHSGGYYVWPNNLLNRPILLWLIVLAGILAMVMAMALVGIYGDP